MNYPARKKLFCIAPLLPPYGQVYGKRSRPMIYHSELLIKRFDNLSPFLGFIDVCVLVLKG
jgi:hypothetical protein